MAHFVRHIFTNVCWKTPITLRLESVLRPVRPHLLITIPAGQLVANLLFLIQHSLPTPLAGWLRFQVVKSQNHIRIRRNLNALINF